MIKQELRVRRSEEDPLLNSLEDFREENQAHKSVADEFKKTKKSLAAKSLSLLERASEVSAFQTMLEERAKDAMQVLTYPIDPLEREQTLVDRLESEVEALQAQVPTDACADRPQELADRRRETQRLQAVNIAKERELEQRRVMCEINQREIEHREFELEALRKHAEEHGMEEIKLKEPASPEVVVAQESLDERRGRKEDLEKRKAAVLQGRAEMEASQDLWKSQLEKDKTFVDETNDEIARLRKAIQEYDSMRVRVDAVLSAKRQLTLADGEADDEIVRVRRKKEKQGPAVEEIERRKQESEEKKRRIDEGVSEITERQKVLEGRRTALLEPQRELAGQKRAVLALRAKSKELEIEERRTDQALKALRTKQAEALENLKVKRDVAFAEGDCPKELKELLGELESE
jgi:hypothetical protein